MTDAHCHVSCGDPTVREFLIGRDFIGIHPWDVDEALDKHGGLQGLESWLRHQLSTLNSQLSTLPGVGEIGLDRLKEKTISPRMREVFEVQLRVALELHRPVVLHGAKCWGQVVEGIKNEELRIQTFLFHGFSRSDGLIPDIVKLNGYVSVGPAVLNDHAVNYRELVKKIPLERLLVETDRTPENAAECPSVREVLAKTAEIRGLTPGELERQTDANADAFIGNLL